MVHEETSTARALPRALYEVTEVADYLRVSKTQVYELIRQGSLASIKIGRLRRITSDAIAAYLDSLEP